MTEFQKYIQRYLDLVPGENILQELKNSEQKTLDVYSKLDEVSSLFRYAENKWTLKEVLQHLIDCERIFQFRALSISRGDQQDFPGFDEEFYAKNSNADERKLSELTDEYWTVRASSILLFKSFTPEMHSKRGFANGNEIAVETIIKLIVGHNLHHLNVIKERYLSELNN